MVSTQIIRTTWYPDQKLLITQLSGDINSQDVQVWEQSLQDKLSLLPDKSVFKIVVDLYGFKAIDFAAHKKFRVIIPELLAQYGWKVGYINLFAEAADMKLTNTRGIQCVAAAHVHQDETKIAKYEAMFGKESERFFTDPVTAEAWIRKVPC